MCDTGHRSPAPMVTPTTMSTLIVDDLVYIGLSEHVDDIQPTSTGKPNIDQTTSMRNTDIDTSDLAEHRASRRRRHSVSLIDDDDSDQRSPTRSITTSRQMAPQPCSSSHLG